MPKNQWSERPLRQKLSLILILALIITSGESTVLAGEIRIAVASNFSPAIREVARQFEMSTGHKVILVFGSTGKHYAQISNGAPFDIFFAADVERPEKLEEKAIAVAGSRFTYATGRLVLWSPDAGVVDAEGEVLEKQGFSYYIAIANPKLAPYGRAAEQVMKAQGVWNALQRRIVRGENIAQAFQFIRSGNAELGFVAYSQIIHDESALKGSLWQPPPSLYDPVEQQAVLLKDDAVAREFLSFVRGEEARMIIKDYGYGLP